jgi:hypothetical protein
MHHKAYTGKHKFKILVGTDHHTKRHKIKKKMLQTQRTVTASGMNKQAIRGDPHQFLVENLDGERRLETPRLKDNIKTDLRETRCGGDSIQLPL